MKTRVLSSIIILVIITTACEVKHTLGWQEKAPYGTTAYITVKHTEGTIWEYAQVVKSSKVTDGTYVKDGVYIRNGKQVKGETYITTFKSEHGFYFGVMGLKEGTSFWFMREHHTNKPILHSDFTSEILEYYYTKNK